MMLKDQNYPQREMLLAIFYLYEDRSMTIREALTAVIEKVCEFGKRARIPLAHKNKMIEKFEVLYQKYQLLKKGRSRRSVTQLTKERAFKDDLKNLFDVASSNALTLITNKQDRDFRLAQREPGRRGSMGAVDMVLACQEEQTEHRKMLKKRCRERAKADAFKSYATVEVESRTAVVVMASHLKIMLTLLKELDLPDKRKQKGKTQT